MDRTLINEELEKFGYTPGDYASYLAYLLGNMSPQSAAKLSSLTVRFKRDYTEDENYVAEKGIVHEEEQAHVHYLEITEKGDFLVMIKEWVLGDFYQRFLL